MMANKHRGEVEIQLDKKRIFKFGTHALAELEDALGHSLSKLGDDIGIKTMVKMVWAALLHQLPDLTYKEAADLMDYSTFDVISKKITEALELQFGSGTEAKKKKSAPSGAGKG
jgi:hypothetical protein